MYILIGLLLGSIVTSTHDNREACEGRKALLTEKGVTQLKCETVVNYGLTIGTIPCNTTNCLMPTR